MKTVLEGNSVIKKLLGEQKISKNAEYKISLFAKTVNAGDATLLFTYFTKELVVLNGEEERELAKTPIPFSETVADLIKKRFLVPVGFDEHALADSVNDALAMAGRRTDLITNFTILPTSACNARCYYCFEENAKKHSMTEETIKATIKFIIEKSKGRPVTIRWFGGEPLVNIKAIDEISAGLKENGIKFTSSMVTNAYLFDEETVKKAKELWNLKWLQITLDGTEKEYNRIKNYVGVGDTNPFYRVIDNINLLIKSKIRVAVRLNVSDDNAEDIDNLIVDLSKLLINDSEFLEVYCINLYETEPFVAEEVLEAKNERIIRLRDRIIKNGLYPFNKKFGLFINRVARTCMAEEPSSVLISPTGKLCRCEHFFEDSDAYGSIFDDKIDIAKYNYWTEHRKIKECETCIFSSTCRGITHCPDCFDVCDPNVLKFRLKNWDVMLTQIYNDYKKTENINVSKDS